MRCCVLALMIGLAAPAVAQLREGTYEVRMNEAGRSKAVPQDPRTTPPGQIRHFLIQKNRWALLDMMVGFQGTYTVKGKEATLLVLESPSGKLGKPQKWAFTLSQDRKTLTSKPMKGSDVTLVFVWKKPAVPIKLPY